MSSVVFTAETTTVEEEKTAAAGKVTPHESPTEEVTVDYRKV